MIKVIIVDDHQMFIDGIKSFLTNDSQIKFVGEATTGRTALTLLDTTEVDVVILDIQIPTMDGEAILKVVKERFPKLKVLAVTMSDKAKDIQRMLHNGADGYLLKDKGKEELIGAIHQVYAGNMYVPLDLIPKAFLSRKKKNMRFTNRECDVLALIMEGCSNKQIAAKLNIETVTVETHCRNMRKKTETNNRMQLANYARKNGLCKEN